MGKQKNRVTKWSPVSPMDFPRFESWLEEMAGKGFLVHRVQQKIKEFDPRAFVVVTDAYDTYGEGFKPLPEPGEIKAE